MHFDVITLFPQMFAAIRDQTIIGRAFDRQICSITPWQLRDYASNATGRVDDKPYGGGAGMVLACEPIIAACKAATQQHQHSSTNKTIIFAPHGRPLCQAILKQYTQYDNLTMICGRYEGIDARVEKLLDADIVSLGDYVISGGELAAMVMIDGIIRLLPNAISAASSKDESFANDTLEYPQYTRPPTFAGLQVPAVLLSGDHQAIEKWRLQQSLQRTFHLRPDLL